MFCPEIFCPNMFCPGMFPEMFCPDLFCPNKLVPMCFAQLHLSRLSTIFSRSNLSHIPYLFLTTHLILIHLTMGPSPPGAHIVYNMWKNVGRKPTFVMIGQSETKKEKNSQR